MSAIYKTSKYRGSLGAGNINRYKTHCKVRIHSHNSENPVDIYDAVYAVDLSKSIKGPGKATISLTPIQNWLNVIFPDDVVNIYFDIGDGSGWTRTFFGYVDRVEEQYSVGQDGSPSTYYRLVCSDFQKVFEKTQIYFNPHLAGRPDFIDTDFADSNIGGLALMSKGLVVGGAPSDVIQDITLLLLGFGTQFRMPSSYAATNSKDRLRARRVELISGDLPKEMDTNPAAAIRTYGTWKEAAEQNIANSVADYYQNTDQEQATKNLAEAFGVDPAEIEGRDKEEIQSLLLSASFTKRFEGVQSNALTGTRQASINRVQNVLESTTAETLSLVDVIDPFTFVERRAMDGFILGDPVWQKQGTVVSIMRAFSNEALNEMFFDLRAYNYDKEKKAVHTELLDGQFARARDDADGNLGGVGAKVGIFYTPALIMREYPFSTVRGINLSDVELSIDNADGDPEKVGYLQFGEIFASKPNDPGRAVISIPNINIVDQAEGGPIKETPGLKHLDIAVVGDEEITKTQLGRSDNDHFNLFEFYSDNVLGTDQKFYMKDFLPVITPVHITRHGLRVRSVTTKAARFSIAAVRGFVRDGVPSLDFAGDRNAASELEIVSDFASPISNVESADVFWNPSNIRANWGYRLKKEDLDDNSTWNWDWHHGIDITQNGEVTAKGKWIATNDTPIVVQAVADGEVVVSAPDGTFSGYGDVVVIRHRFRDTQFFYSVYSHLKSRSVGWLRNKKTGTVGMRGAVVARDTTGVKAGRQVPIPIKRGDPVGILGRTGVRRSKAHLHFEIVRHFPVAPKSDGALNQTRTIAYDPNDPSRPDPIVDLLLDVNDSADDLSQVTFDPASCFGGVFVQGLSNSAAEGGEAENDRAVIAVEPEDTNPSKKDNNVSDEADDLAESPGRENAPRDNVDTASSRKQIFRWGMLQDHWYQHNLEYLSGQVAMRGAPEIRVGYRLDLRDRGLSSYVEGVTHSWRYPNNMKTTLAVSRGQPNNPFPVYVLPAYAQLGAQPKQRRTNDSRLAKYFITPDPIAIRRSLFLRDGKGIFNNPGNLSHLETTGSGTRNETDVFTDAEINEEKGYIIVSPKGADKEFKEAVIRSASNVDTKKDLTKTNNAESTAPAGRQSRGSVKHLPPARVQKKNRS